MGAKTPSITLVSPYATLHYTLALILAWPLCYPAFWGGQNRKTNLLPNLSAIRVSPNRIRVAHPGGVGEPGFGQLTVSAGMNHLPCVRPCRGNHEGHCELSAWR